jgi:hypothetical protein
MPYGTHSPFGGGSGRSPDPILDGNDRRLVQHLLGRNRIDDFVDPTPLPASAEPSVTFVDAAFSIDELSVYRSAAQADRLARSYWH